MPPDPCTPELTITHKIDTELTLELTLRLEDIDAEEQMSLGERVAKKIDLGMSIEDAINEVQRESGKYRRTVEKAYEFFKKST